MRARTFAYLGISLFGLMIVAMATTKPTPTFTPSELAAAKAKFAKEAKEGWKPEVPSSSASAGGCEIGADAANPRCETEAQMIQERQARHVQRCLNNPSGWFCNDVNSQPRVYVIRPVSPDGND